METKQEQKSSIVIRSHLGRKGNHEIMRYIIKKGSSIKDLKEEDVYLLMNSINSYPRASLGGKSPYDVFVFLYGKEGAEKLELKKIPFDELVLTPNLI